MKFLALINPLAMRRHINSESFEVYERVTGLYNDLQWPADMSSDAKAIARGDSRSGPDPGRTELRVLLADLVGQSLQLSAVEIGGNCRVVWQQFETVDSMNSPPDVEDPFFISSDNGVQPVESTASGEQLSADVRASLTVAVAQCMWEPPTELSHHPERSQSITHGGQRRAKTGSKTPHTFI
ncbi:hypothetical protein RB195_019267 [Necator americanus]|uniref:Uncharacterized protein n=1 Tax=Necator americanus TaxID=51031 RepID=A0ABR1CDC8_NECAM